MTALIELSDGADPGWTLLASPAHAQRAQDLGRRRTAARGFFTRLFNTDVDKLRALMLDEPDWREHCPFPDYGMPFHQTPATLYAAAADPADRLGGPGRVAGEQSIVLRGPQEPDQP